MAGFRTDEFPEEIITHQDPAKWFEQDCSMHFHAGPMFKINEFSMVIYSILCSWSTPHFNNNMHNKQSKQQTWTTATKKLLATKHKKWPFSWILKPEIPRKKNSRNGSTNDISYHPSSLPGRETIPRADFNVNHLHIHCLGCGGFQLLRSDQWFLRICKLKIMGCLRREVCSYIRYYKIYKSYKGDRLFKSQLGGNQGLRVSHGFLLTIRGLKGWLFLASAKD